MKIDFKKMRPKNFNSYLYNSVEKLAKNVEKGIRKFVNRQRGTSMAVDKMTGKAKVPARESVEVSEKHVYRFSTKTKQGNIHHSSKDDTGAKKAIEKRRKRSVLACGDVFYELGKLPQI